MHHLDILNRLLILENFKNNSIQKNEKDRRDLLQKHTHIDI